MSTRLSAVLFRYAALVSYALFVGSAMADSPAALATDPRLEPLAFMTGAWLSEPDKISGQSEEQWSVPMGCTMIGMFRSISPTCLDPTVSFELLTLTAESGGVKLRLRHHNAALIAREEKDKPMTLRLDSAENGKAVFKPVSDARDLERVVYESRGPDRLAIELDFKPESNRAPLKFDLARRPVTGSAGSAGATPITPESARALFDRFKKLEGSWRGKSTKGWTETITYKPIAAGSCIMDTSFDAHPNETMVTMLCLDNDRLILTHYCVAKNQPRLLATGASDDLKSVTFTFMDGGNLGPKGREKGHMDKCAVTFIDDDHFTSRWTWYQDGKESWMEEIQHERVKADAEPRAVENTAPHSHH